MAKSVKLLSFYLLLLTFMEFQSFTFAAKILFLTPMATKSHKNVFDPLIDELARRNHEITVISPMKSSKVKSVREIVPMPMEKVMQSLTDPIQIRKGGFGAVMNSLNITLIESICDHMYKNEEVKKLIANEHFDLIFVNGFVNQCAYGLILLFKTPWVIVTTMPAPQSIAALVGNNFPSSFVPEPFFPLSDRMTFGQRVMNFVAQLFISGHAFLMTPRMERFYKKHLPDSPPISEAYDSLRMIFMNSHFSLNSPRPLLPSVIEVGGMHCQDGKPLPKDLEDFLSGAEHGFILFSMGSIIQSKNMPEQARKSLLNVFSRLKQRVLWKWDKLEMPEKLPSNIKLSTWVPQQDVLAHKNIRMFITHGGLLSTQETVYHGVPIIGIPVFADQDLNMKLAEDFGYCLTLDILDLTEESLEKAIKRILTEKEFSEKAKSLSSIYRDQPETALERAVFWTEYILRHKGADHIQSSAKDLNFIQYHSLDVIAFLLTLTTLTLWLLKFILWNVFVCKIVMKVLFSKTSRNEKHKRFATKKKNNKSSSPNKKQE